MALQTQTPMMFDMLSLEELERIRQERLAEARRKRLLEKAVLVVKHKGENGYLWGRIFQVVVLPHPNKVDVVRILLFEKGRFDPAFDGYATRQRVIVWVHQKDDFDPARPLYAGKTWVQVFQLDRVVPQGAYFPITDEEKARWFYVPGRWEEALSAAASEVAREIAERQEAKAAKEAERLWELLFPQRDV